MGGWWSGVVIVGCSVDGGLFMGLDLRIGVVGVGR